MMVDLGFCLNFRLKSKPWMVAIGDNGIEYHETGGIQPRRFPDNSQIVLYILPLVNLEKDPLNREEHILNYYLLSKQIINP